MILNSHYAVELLARERRADFLRVAERRRLTLDARRAKRAYRKARKSNRRSPAGDIAVPAPPVAHRPKQPSW